MSYLRTAMDLAKVVLGSGVVAVMAEQSLYDVDGGERAVIYDRARGILPSVEEPGLRFKIPLLQYPVIYDIRDRPRTVNTQTGTKDLQTVNISLRVLYHPEETKLPDLHNDMGEDYDDRIMPSIVPEILKAIVAKYDAEELITQRDLVSKDISDTLTQRAETFSMIVSDVAITHLNFMREFERAIEHKQIAQQEAERSKFVVAMAEQEKQAAIIRAEGEAEAAKIITEAIERAGEGVIQVRRIDAAKEIAETLSQSGNVVYVPNSGNMLLGLSAAR
jgi:prohibitin 1